MVLIDIVKRQLTMTNALIEDTKQKLKQYEHLEQKKLVVRNRNNGTADYYEQKCDGGTVTLDPLGKSDSKTVTAYKRKRYLMTKLEVLEEDKKISEKFLRKYRDYSPEVIVDALPKRYQGLPINSYENTELRELPPSFGHVPDKIYADPRFQELLEWAAQDYKRNPYPLPDDPNIARDGRPMRSKGECMWYDDILFDGLPVWIDPEIKLKGKSGQWHTFHPDFIFKCFDGTYIYVEHFGYLDDDEYAEKAKRKLQEYLDCGIVLGDNLIVTSDNADHRTNEIMIREALDKIKKRMFA